MKAELLLKKISNNWFGKCLSLGAAIILFLVAQITRLEKRTFSVPLTTVEDGILVHASGLPSHVNVTVRAESENILNIASSDIKAFLDLSYYTKEGTYSVPITLSLSADVVLTDPVELTVSPENYSVILEERVRRSVPVVVPTSGNPTHGYELKEIKVYPDEAIISGPRSMVENISQLSTDELILTEKKDDFEESKTVRNVSRYIEIVNPKQASVKVSFQTSLVQKSFFNCPVFFGHLAPNLEVAAEPEISFTVSGAELILEKFYPSEYTVQVDCSHIMVPGEYELPVVIAVQDAFKIESQSASSVKVKIREKEVESENDGENISDSGTAENSPADKKARTYSGN